MDNDRLNELNDKLTALNDALNDLASDEETDPRITGFTSFEGFQAARESLLYQSKLVKGEIDRILSSACP